MTFDHARYQRDRYQRRHDEAIRLLGGCCESCGNTTGLTFRCDEGRRPVTRMFGKSAWETIETELDHWYLLCPNCCRTPRIETSHETPVPSHQA